MKRLVILVLFIFSTVFYSQEDSLHLVFTLTGENTKNPITACSGLGDINNDGFDDFVIRRDSVNYCEIYYGGKILDLSKPLKLYDQPDVDMGILSNIGDVNGDGYFDYAEEGFLNNGGFPLGIIYVFYGSSEFDTIPDWSFRVPNCIDGILTVGAGSGDINGDGVDDLVIGEPYNWCNGFGKAYIFYGGDTLSTEPNVTLQNGIRDSHFGKHLCLGDINGDFYADLIISAPDLYGLPDYNGKVYFYFGGTTISQNADLILDMNSSSTPLRTFILPDFNGDGINDLFIHSNSDKLYFGSSTFDTTNYLIMPAEGSGYIGDINNDGYSDLLLSNPYYLNSNGIMVGDAEIYLGSNKPDTTMDYFFEGETKWGGFGNGSILGDINGDGYDDFFILAVNYPDVENPLGKIYVYSMKKFLVGVNEDRGQTPQNYELKQNYPNPFGGTHASGSATTTIKYSIPNVTYARASFGVASPANVRLTVYDILGRKVATLVNKTQAPGNYSVQFNAANLPSGVYFYTLQAGNFQETKKMILMK